jgi:O-6-methylguanine DNA methyltransferase
MLGFRQRVLERVAEIPEGRVATYKELARAVGRPRAWRAVARALATNPSPMKIPCHRVVRSDGRIGGYRLSVRRKEELLRREGVEIRDGKIDLGRHVFRFRNFR